MTESYLAAIISFISVAVPQAVSAISTWRFLNENRIMGYTWTLGGFGILLLMPLGNIIAPDIPMLINGSRYGSEITVFIIGLLFLTAFQIYYTWKVHDKSGIEKGAIGWAVNSSGLLAFAAVIWYILLRIGDTL